MAFLLRGSEPCNIFLQYFSDVQDTFFRAALQEFEYCFLHMGSSVAHFWGVSLLLIAMVSDPINT